MVLPQLASLRLAVFEESGKLIGHRVIPVVGLCPGYRHVVLRNEMGQPLLCGTLFLRIAVKDYVPDGLSDFAEALANPIKFQSDLDKRTKQLAVFADELDQSIEPNEVSELCKIYLIASYYIPQNTKKYAKSNHFTIQLVLIEFLSQLVTF